MSTKISLSAFCIGHCLLGMGPACMKLRCRKLIFPCKRCQLEVASRLEIGGLVLVPVSALRPHPAWQTCAGPMHAATIALRVHMCISLVSWDMASLVSSFLSGSFNLPVSLSAKLPKPCSLSCSIGTCSPYVFLTTQHHLFLLFCLFILLPFPFNLWSSCLL